MQIEYISIEKIFEGIPLKRKTLDGELRKLPPEFADGMKSILRGISSCDDLGRLDSMVETYIRNVATIANPNVDIEVLKAALKRHVFFGKVYIEILPEEMRAKVFGYQEARQNA